MAELVGAFSYALDITEGQPPGHCVRSCYIGSRLGVAVGMTSLERHELYYTLLLKDLGCSSNAARICELYATDDRALKHDFKLVGQSLPATLRFVFARTGTGKPLGQRAAAIGNILVNGKRIVPEVIRARCTRGAHIARTLGFPESVCDGIFNLDEHWDGSGHPEHIAGEAIPVYSRIALLAQVAEVFHSSLGREAAIAEVERRSGSWFDPSIAQAFLGLAREPGFWQTLESPWLESLLIALAPSEHAIHVDEPFLDSIADAFGQVIDAKSPYTAGHSARVAVFAEDIARRMGMADGRCRTLRRAAALHDIGKLGVSNAILDKPGSLDEREWAEMRDHAAHTGEILSRISALSDMARIAASHHERLDGTGYPLCLKNSEICRETRIITTCDFYDALTADRPYRAAMPSEQALAIMEAEIGRAIDGECFDALRSAVDD